MFVGSLMLFLDHMTLSMGYPATGHFIVSVLPATADIGCIGRTNGIPFETKNNLVL